MALRRRNDRRPHYAVRIDEWGDVREREIFGGQPGEGAWPDGIAFDSPETSGNDGVFNKLFALTPEGDSARVSRRRRTRARGALERAFCAMRSARNCSLRPAAEVAPWMASVTFGGPDCAPSTSVAQGDTHSIFLPRPFPDFRWSIGTSGPLHDRAEPCAPCQNRTEKMLNYIEGTWRNRRRRTDSRDQSATAEELDRKPFSPASEVIRR